MTVLPLASLFDSLFPGKGSSKAIKDPAERQRLVSELLQIASKSKLVSPPAEVVAKVKRLSDDLIAFGKDSKALEEGSWEVAFSSSPTLFPLMMGPTESPLTLGDGSPLPIEQFQKVGKDVLLYSLVVEVKTLGFITGSFETRGSVVSSSNQAYDIDLNETSYKNGLGSTVIKRIKEVITSRLIYADDKIKVTSSRINEDEDECLVVSIRKEVGSESSQSQGRVQRPTSSSPSSNIIPSIFGGKPKTTSGFATRSERVALRKMEQDSQKRGQKRQPPSSPSMSPAEIQKRQEDIKARARARENERKDNQAKIVKQLREADEMRAREKALSQPSQEEIAQAKSMLEIASEILKRAMGERKE